MDNLFIYSHRGASAYALENTWKAFQKACELNVGIELDVQITKDGVVVVYHDDNLKRLSGKNLPIGKVEFAKIKDIKLGKLGRRRFSQDRIPLAYEVFKWAQKKSIPLNIEIKESFALHPEGPEILASMLEGMKEIHLSSFNSELLRKMKNLKPDIETALVVKRVPVMEYMDKMTWIDSLHLHKRIYSEELYKKIKSKFQNIRVYGVLGNEKTLNCLLSNVSGIITDYPDKVQEKMRAPH